MRQDFGFGNGPKDTISHKDTRYCYRRIRIHTTPLIPRLSCSIRQDCTVIFFSRVKRGKREKESMSDPYDSTSTGDGVSLSSSFLEFCGKVRNKDLSILPRPGEPFKIRRLSEKEDIELADALLENTSVTHLELETEKYTKSSAEAMAMYVRTSKRLQHIHWTNHFNTDHRESVQSVLQQHREEMFCCFLPAFQESTSLKELHIKLPYIGGLSHLAFEKMLTHTQSLRSLSLIESDGLLEDTSVATVRSGLKKNTSLRELTLEFARWETTISSILTSLRDHPRLRRLRLFGNVVNLTGLETVLLSENSKITELEIHRYDTAPPLTGLTCVLQALGRRPMLTKLVLNGVPLDRNEARQLGSSLHNTPSLQTLILTDSTLGSAGFAQLARALYCNTYIKVLDISDNCLNGMESARVLRDIILRNKTITALHLSGNFFGVTTGAVECITGGVSSNSTLLKIDLSKCCLGDHGVSILAQTFGSRNTMLQKLELSINSITSMGVGVLLEAMEQNSHHIAHLDLRFNLIENEGASLLARSLGRNALPNLTRLSLSCGGMVIGDDGFIALVSALEQNTSLLHLDLLRYDDDISERAFLALAESLPEIKMLQQVNFRWCTGLASAMPLLLAGLRKNTSLFRFYVTGCEPTLVPPTTEETVKCAGG
jgi:Ran GTPase-activating protein (RanGAP) involved in mRNA processing and transport